MNISMKCYRVYNRKLNKFAPRGRIDTVKIAGYAGKYSNNDKLIEKFWNYTSWDEPYHRKQDAKRQLKYLRDAMPDYAPHLVIIEFDLNPVKEYTLVGDKLVENSNMLRLIYG